MADVRRLPNSKRHDDDGSLSLWDQLDDTGRGVLLFALLMCCIAGAVLALRMRGVRDRQRSREEYRIRSLARDEANRTLSAWLLHTGTR